MTSVEKLSERIKHGFGIEITEFHRINRRMIDRFSWFAIGKSNTGRTRILGSYRTVKELLKSETLYLSDDYEIEPVPIFVNSSHWTKENENT